RRGPSDGAGPRPWSAPPRSPPPPRRAGNRATGSRRSRGKSLRLSRVDIHHLAEEVERVAAGPLEGVPADDRAEAAPVPDRAHLVEERGSILRLPAREDDDAPAVEGALHDVAHPLGERRDRDALLLVDLLGRRLLDVRRGRLHLDDVSAELRRDLGRV